MAEPERTCGTCATCRWWDREGERWNHDAYEPPEYRACRLTGTDEHGRRPESLAHAWDPDSYKAELWTAPDFGCVQWTPATLRPDGASGQEPEPA